MGKTPFELFVGVVVTLGSIKVYADLKKSGRGYFYGPTTPWLTSETQDFLIAHRGASYNFPENTLLAFSHAIKNGAKGFELDVRTTKDGIPVICHDENLKRLTGLDVKISELNHADLPKILSSKDFKLDSTYYSPSTSEHSWPVSFEEQHLPTLQEVFEYFPNVPFFIDMKCKKDEDIESVMRVLHKFSSKNPIVVMSFNHSAIEYVRALHQEFPTAASMREVVTFKLLSKLSLEGLVQADYSVLSIPVSKYWATAMKKKRSSSSVFSSISTRFIDWLVDWKEEGEQLEWLRRAKGVKVISWVAVEGEQKDFSQNFKVDGIMTETFPPKWL
eukprot:GDKJ01004214.1.p1 GENE.GDKJ01004214.1~~GDKJ01004214.1.p1  ORF type:complete len:340 (-),score=85.61 GDKJ01004214.1:176-1168(-)